MKKGGAANRASLFHSLSPAGVRFKLGHAAGATKFDFSEKSNFWIIDFEYTRMKSRRKAKAGSS
jgi:hypothetical protein